MNKVIVTMICIIVVVGAIFTGIILSKPSEKEKVESITTEVAEEEILDECTEEYEESKGKMLEANSEEEKISPNSSFTQKKFYEKCGHTTRQYLKLPEDLVNKTKEQLQESYPNWKIETFSSNEVVLSQKVEGECGEHYLVKNQEGKITIYQIQENGEQVEFERTEITTEYLPETDKINMEKGIKVNGKEELNQLIEDFE